MWQNPSIFDRLSRFIALMAALSTILCATQRFA